MKSFILILFLIIQPLLIFASSSIERGKNSPHLILHFDVNKTLIAQDKVSQKSAHDVVSACIADRVKALWDRSIERPISYSEYIKYHKLKNDESSPEIKKEQDKLISKVLKVLKNQNHPQLEEMQSLYQKAMDVLSDQKTPIFNSFYKLIDYLEERNIKYTLAIRTFGSDLSDIVQEINEKYGKNFIQEKDSFQNEDLYKICQKGNIAIRDDYENWFFHQKKWQFGKPFPVESRKSSTVSLFFDDNADHNELYPDKNIVCPYDIETGQPIHPKQLIGRKRLIPVDMLKAISDENYYIYYVQNALEKTK